MNLKERIKKASSLPKQRVEVEEWAGDDGEPCIVYLQSLSASQFDAIMRSVKNDFGGDVLKRPNWRAWFVCQVLVDEKGVRVFDDGEEDALGEKDSQTVQRLYDLAAVQNGLTSEAEEDLGKNSDPIPDEL